MICWKQQESWKDRKKKKTEQILHYGKQLHRNISCAGKVPGEWVFQAGISSVLPWQQNTWASNSIFMEEEWTCCFRIMKVKLHKALSAIIYRRSVTGFIIT